jgi:serine/threonine-protein kinase
MGDVLKKFGRYFLLDHIAQGGMAEIYRARLASVDGAGRLIVIKRIQAGYGANSEFLQMFKSEIKVTMGFNHPNIVQLYDFGEEQQQPYIAMEFVDGRNLRQFMARFNELKQPFPIELAAYIIEQAAGGLHYAHSFKDKMTGAPLNIVHRDISPQNILISYDGNVKVIDFGIAKANNNSESTRAGVIKGKPSYLSPEQISGEALDGRCDIFALGIVLWELLCGKKLFAGESDLAVLKLIESCTSHVKPPSTINPQVPKELDYIVLRALAKQREKRYQTGEEMQRALHKFIYQFNGDFEPGALSITAKDLFKNEIVEDRKRIQRLNEKVEQLLATDIPDAPPAPSAAAPGKPKEDNTTTMVDAKARMQAAASQAFGQDKGAKLELEGAPAPSQRPLGSATQTRSRPNSSHGVSAGASRSAGSTRVQAPPQQRIPSQRNGGGGLGKLVGIGVAATLAISIFGPEYGIEVPVLSAMLGDMLGGGEAKVVLTGNDSGASVTVNGKTVAHGLPATLQNIPVGTSFHVAVTGSGGVFQQDLTLKKGEKKVVAVTFAASGGGSTTVVSSDSSRGGGDINQVVPGKSILLRLNVTPGGGAPLVTVNGKAVDMTNPSIVVQLDAPLELAADRMGYKPFRREFVLESHQMGGLKEWLMDVPLEPTRFGFLTVHTTPSADATIVLDGKPWTRKTPIENEKFPIGTYSIKLSNEVLGMEKTITVSIQEGKAVTRDERLEIMGSHTFS